MVLPSCCFLYILDVFILLVLLRDIDFWKAIYIIFLLFIYKIAFNDMHWSDKSFRFYGMLWTFCLRNDTPIYKEYSDKQRPRVYVVYIGVNMEICTHVSPWHNFINLNADMRISNPFVCVRKRISFCLS